MEIQGSEQSKAKGKWVWDAIGGDWVSFETLGKYISVQKYFKKHLGNISKIETYLAPPGANWHPLERCDIWGGSYSFPLLHLRGPPIFVSPPPDYQGGGKHVKLQINKHRVCNNKQIHQKMCVEAHFVGRRQVHHANKRHILRSNPSQEQCLPRPQWISGNHGINPSNKMCLCLHFTNSEDGERWKWGQWGGMDQGSILLLSANFPQLTIPPQFWPKFWKWPHVL